MKTYQSRIVLHAAKVVDYREAITTVKECSKIEANDGKIYHVPEDIFSRTEPTGEFYLTRHKNGFQSWCPADVFEAGHHRVEEDGFDFGRALSLMKEGQKVARAGWNGKGMFAYYVPAATYPASRNKNGTILGHFPDDMVPYRHYLSLKTAQDDVATWSPSTSDALAEDWFLYQETPAEAA